MRASPTHEDPFAACRQEARTLARELSAVMRAGLRSVALLAALLALPAWPVQAMAAAIALPGARAFITNQGSHDVSVIDLDSGRELRRIPVAAGPAGVAVDVRHDRVYVTSPDGRMLTRIGARSLAVEATLELGGGPVGVAVDPAGSTVYVADWFRNALVVVDAQSFTVRTRIPVGRAPAGIAVAPDGHKVYVAERDEDRVAVIDMPTGVVSAHVAVGTHPFGLALSPEGSRLFAVNVLSNNVSVIDTASLAVLATVAVGNTPYCAALADDGRLFVTNQHGDSLSVVDPAAGRQLAKVPVDGFPEGIVADGPRILVVSWMDEELLELDALSMRVLRRIPTGHNSRGFGAFLWRPVAHGDEPTLQPKE